MRPPPIFAGQLPLAIQVSRPFGRRSNACIAAFERDHRREHRRNHCQEYQRHHVISLPQVARRMLPVRRGCRSREFLKVPESRLPRVSNDVTMRTIRPTQQSSDAGLRHLLTPLAFRAPV